MRHPLTALMISIALTGCAASRVNPDSATVSGEAIYRERIAVPPGARFEALLEDVSLADAPSIRIGEAVVENAGQPPYRFRIAYDPERIIESHTYAVRVTLRHDGRLLFISDTHTPVITGGNPNDVRIVMKMVASP